MLANMPGFCWLYAHWLGGVACPDQSGHLLHGFPLQARSTQLPAFSYCYKTEQALLSRDVQGLRVHNYIVEADKLRFTNPSLTSLIRCMRYVVLDGSFRQTKREAKIRSAQVAQPVNCETT